MFVNKMNKTRCFLCFCKPKQGDILKNAEKLLCPLSKKPLLHVIQYIANSAKIKIKLAKDTLLCVECCRKVLKFDENMMNVMKQKQHLLDSIQKAMTRWDFEAEENCKRYDDIFVTVLSDEKCEESPTKETEKFDKQNEKKSDLSELENSDIEVSMDSEINEADKDSNKTVLKLNNYSCHMCETRFESKKELDKHMNLEHKKFKCDVCDFAHYNENQVVLHKNKHQGLAETQCPICHKHFSKKVSTIRHMECHTDLQKYQCDKCGLRFSQSTVFNNHKMRHDAEENPLFCNICQQQFKTIKTFRRHAITHREDRPRYTCENCSKSFSDKYTLKVHKRMHTKENQRQHKWNSSERTNSTLNCIICDQLFTNKDQLDKHMKNDHDVIFETVHLNNSTEP